MPIAGRVRYAVVGAGNIAQEAVLPAFAHAGENSELVALVSSNETKRAELATRYGLIHTGSYADFERVLREAGTDAVYITVPNHVHCEFTKRAAQLGIHVLCEKPMALSEADCRAMIAATTAGKCKLMIAYRLHFEEATLAAIESASSGTLGELRAFTSTFSQQVRPGDIRTRSETGGGALFDLGPYCVNAARCLFRAEPLEVFAFQARGAGDGASAVDTMTTGILRFDGDRFAQFTVNQEAASISSYRIVGTKGDLRVEPAYDYQMDLVHHLTADGQARDRVFPKRDQFAPELVYFSNCILEDLEPEPSGFEGLADVRTLCALAESAKTGRPVRLAPFEHQRWPDIRQHIYKPAAQAPAAIQAPPPTMG